MGKIIGEGVGMHEGAEGITSTHLQFTQKHIQRILIRTHPLPIMQHHLSSHQAQLRLLRMKRDMTLTFLTLKLMMSHMEAALMVMTTLCIVMMEMSMVPVSLRHSPPEVIPQCDRRPRWICDYSWWGG